MAATDSIDIILPCYNPEDCWEENVIGCIQKLKEEFSHNFLCNLIIVNDGSTKDLSKSIARILNLIPETKFIDHKINRGKGHALISGMQKTTAQFVIFTDYDIPYDHDSMVRMVKNLGSNEHDIIVGTRKSSYYTKIPLHRKAISLLLKNFNKWFLNLEVADTQAGLKGFGPRGIALFKKLKTDGFLIDLELLVKAKRQQLDVGSIPIYLNEKTVISKMKFWPLIVEFKNLIWILLNQ